MLKLSWYLVFDCIGADPRCGIGLRGSRLVNQLDASTFSAFSPPHFPDRLYPRIATLMYEGIAKLPRYFLGFKHYCPGYLIQGALACLHFPTMIHYT